MGYNLTIGERGARDKETKLPDVATVKLDHAPAFNEPTDFTNERWPSYSGWADFLKETGLQWLSPRTDKGFEKFVRPDCPPLMVEHPGVQPILPVHREAIDAAYNAYREKIGHDKIPGWAGGEQFNHATGKFEQAAMPERPDLYDGNLARLVWLRFWIHWALDNCKKPVFLNT